MKLRLGRGFQRIKICVKFEISPYFKIAYQIEESEFDEASDEMSRAVRCGRLLVLSPESRLPLLKRMKDQEVL